MEFLLRVVFFLAVNTVLPGIHVAGLKTAIFASIVYGIVKFFFKPILKILSIPINILTLGLFNLVINGAILYLSAVFYSGIYIRGFWDAVLGAIILSLLEMVFLENR